MQYVPIFFAPDLDTSWAANPGCLRQMDGFAPLQNGAYGTTASSNYFSPNLTGADHLHAQMFRQVNGTVRLLTFRKQNIDEYSSVGGRTNQGTGYNASTTGWSAAAWGNQIIACNYLDATQSSTGGAFSGLGSGAPKARHVASNLDHVMFADVDDGGSNVFSDMVWWSDLQNPGNFTPTIGGEAGFIRLLQAPGPIRALVAYRDMFVAFKDNAIIVGQYQGGLFPFAFRMVSSIVGTPAAKSVVEVDGKLYFFHQSGFYSFDGNVVQQIGLPVNQSFITEANYATSFVTEALPPGSITSDAVSTIQATTDDLEGIVLWKGAYFFTSGNAYWTFVYSYNARSGKWGRYTDRTDSGAGGLASSPCWVRCSNADMQAFLASTTTRVLMIYNSLVGGGTNLKAIAYPTAYNMANGGSTFRTGAFGSPDGSVTLTKMAPRCLAGSDALNSSCAANPVGYNAENKATSPMSQSITGANVELQCFDLLINSKFFEISNSFSTTKQIVSGVYIDPPLSPATRRR